MAFGFGKKDKQPPQQQISPEALALLEQMAQTGAAAQAPQAGQPIPDQAMQQPAMAPIQAAPAQPATPQTPVPGAPDPASMQAQAQQMDAAMQGGMPGAVPGAVPGAMTGATPPVGATAPQMGVPAAPLQPDMNMAPAAGQPQAAMGQMPGFTAPMMPDAGMAVDPTPEKKGWRGKKAKKPAKQKLTREEKKLAAKSAKEEKIRAKRRKKLSKSRFSRARYLREANGNAIAGLALWIFTIIVVVAGLFVLNTQFLLPQTRENNDIINQISQLRDTIERSRPQLEIAVRNKSERENQIKQEAGNFIPQTAAQGLLEQFVQDLRDSGIAVSEDNPPRIFAENLGVTGLSGQSLHLSINADFLTYLRIRNRFVAAQRSIRVTEEVITATPGDPIMAISLKLTIPARGS